MIFYLNTVVNFYKTQWLLKYLCIFVCLSQLDNHFLFAKMLKFCQTAAELTELFRSSLKKCLPDWDQLSPSGLFPSQTLNNSDVGFSGCIGSPQEKKIIQENNFFHPPAFQSFWDLMPEKHPQSMMMMMMPPPPGFRLVMCPLNCVNHYSMLISFYWWVYTSLSFPGKSCLKSFQCQLLKL